MTKGTEMMIELRKYEFRITQKELSEKTGITRTTIASIEAGINNPSVETAKVLAKFLGFDWTLFFEEGE